MLPSRVVRGRRNPQHFGFPLRLARARKAAGLTAAALSLTAGMAHNTAGDLEAGGRHPRVDTVGKLASVLRISPGLLAYGIESSWDCDAALLSSGLPARLAQLRQERGLSCRELGRRSNTSHNFVQMTETGATVPSIAKVEQLAQALKVSPCWLAFGLGEKELAPSRRTGAAAARVQPA